MIPLHKLIIFERNPDCTLSHSVSFRYNKKAGNKTGQITKAYFVGASYGTESINTIERFISEGIRENGSEITQQLVAHIAG